MLVVGDAVWAATPKPIFGLRDGLGHDAGFSEVLLESRGRGETRVVVGAWITYGHPDLGL